MPPFDLIGGSMGTELKLMMATAFETIMHAVWEGSLLLLLGAFGLADQFSVFTVDTRTGPISVLWPMMLWISGAMATGLFFWQLVVTNLRGGRGFLRLIGGPVQYGAALAVAVGVVGAFLSGVDGLTNGILEYGLQSKNFTEALEHTSFGDGAVDGVKATVLGLCALAGVLPASVGFVLEMLFREAAIYVLAATIPLSAAGLLANVTARWFWRTCRWMLACIAMKPVLALALVLGVAISGGSQGLSGLLAGVGVLIISLFCPLVLFRLFAFVDPHTDPGAAFRDALSGIGVDSYGRNNPAVMAAGAAGGIRGGGAIEDANTDRFDAAAADHAEDTEDSSEVGRSGTVASDGDGRESEDSGASDRGPARGGGDRTQDDTAGGEDRAGDEDSSVPPPANLGRVVSSSPHTGPAGSYDGGDRSGGRAGGGETDDRKSSDIGRGTATGTEEGAVVL